MVKVRKTAVWVVEGQYFEKADEAEKATRREVIREMLVDEENMFQGQSPADWMADNWDTIANRVKTAMAGT